jgi:exosome complex component RRP45
MLQPRTLQDGNTLIIDPSLKEEAAMQGSATIIVNPNREVCAVHKAGGVGLSSSQLFRYEQHAAANG